MLTSDLVNARVRKGVLHPALLDASAAELDRCQAVLQTWRDHLECPREELDEVLKALEGDGTDFIVWRGLSKLVSDLAVFQVASDLDPSVVRATVFALAAGEIPRNAAERQAILNAAAVRLGADPSKLTEAMYADLVSRQVLESVPSWDAEELLQRYNVALAQGVLYRAASLEVRFVETKTARVRDVLAALKFFGLMHDVHQNGSQWTIRVDGPAAVVSQSRKYGVNLATFLPVVFGCEDWAMEADVEWQPRKVAKLALASSGIALMATRKKRGSWQSDEEKMLMSRFKDGVEGWLLARKATVVKLDRGEVIVADYQLTSPDGEVVVVDVVGFWRQAYLARRSSLFSQVSEGVVMVVADRMKTEGERIEEHSVPVVYFKGVVKPNELIEAARRALS